MVSLRSNARGHGGDGVVGLRRLDGVVAWQHAQCGVLFATYESGVCYADDWFHGACVER